MAGFDDTAELSRCGRRGCIVQEVNNGRIAAEIGRTTGGDSGIEVVLALGENLARVPHEFLGRTGEIGHYRRQAGDIGRIGSLSAIEGNRSIAYRVKGEPAKHDRVFCTHFLGRDGKIHAGRDHFAIVHKIVGIEHVPDRVVGREGYMRGIGCHVEG